MGPRVYSPWMSGQWQDAHLTCDAGVTLNNHHVLSNNIARALYQRQFVARGPVDEHRHLCIRAKGYANAAYNSSGTCHIYG